MRTVTFTAVALTAAITAAISPTSASALTQAELKCQHSIGDVAHQFADHKLKAIRIATTTSPTSASATPSAAIGA